MKKKGISLILLVITIIIIIIIASAVILNLNNNNPVNKARLANVQSTRDSLKSGINLYIGKIMVKENGNHNASTMILGKNSQVIDYSIVHDYSMYETIRGNLNIWQLDYSAINEKVNLKLDIYDNNSRWYIDSYGNPFLVYNSMTNVSPYLKSEDNTDIHTQVKDFVVVLDNVEFAENSTLGVANTNKASITNAVSKYLASQNISSTTLEILTDSTNGIASSTDTTNITKNDEEITLYKIDSTKYQAKTGSTLPTTDENSDWYVDEDGNVYLIYNNEDDIPESMSSGVTTSSYVTYKEGTITAHTVSNASSSSNNNENNNNNSDNNNQTSNKQEGSITLSSTKGELTYLYSLDITVTNPNNAEITAESSDTDIAMVSVSGNTVTVMAKSSAGDATITITASETDEYLSVSKTYSITVWDDAGEMPVSAAKAINASNIASYIGRVVNYHPANDSTGVYRIFYLDTEGKYDPNHVAGTLFIKRDYEDGLTYNVGSSAISDNSTYSGSDIGIFNPLWKNVDNNINNSNETYAAYLCTKIDENNSYTRNWRKCYDKSQGAQYVIGSPSVEMYMDAYNQWGGYASGRGPQSYKFDSGAFGYSVGVNGTYSNSGNYQNDNSLSAGPSSIFYTTNKYLWLASPVRYDAYAVLNVRGNYANVDGYYSGTYGVCPLVSLGS